MKPDVHQTFRTMIDDAIVAEPSTPQPAALLTHLQSCEACRHYLDNTSRVIATFGNYSFAVDRSHNATVFHALEQRSAQLKADAVPETSAASSFSRRQLAWACALAVLLTAAGLAIDLRFGTLLASFLPSYGPQAKEGLRIFWLMSSIGSLLLFPLLPLLSQSLSSPPPLSPP